MLKLIFIRHGATPGNLEKRYIGRTDEPLSEKGCASLNSRAYPPVNRVYTSPMLRCRQTAELIYPGVERRVIYDFRECDFGDFEGKNYIELSGDARYQAWVDSGGTIPFPNGERQEDFKRRCCEAFERIVAEEKPGGGTLAFVVHGGTIMSVFERHAEPQSSYYDWQIDNGCGYQTELDGQQRLRIIRIV